MDIQQAIEIAYPLLEALLASSPDRVIVYDPQGRFLFANAAAKAFPGQSPKDPRGRSWQELGFPVEIGHPFEARLLQVVQNRSEIRAEESLPLEGGKSQYMETILSPVFAADGSVAAVLNIVRDITAQKSAEAELRRSEEKFERTFRLTPDAISITRLTDGVLLEVNEAFQISLGYSREECLGKSTAELGIWADPCLRDHFFAAIREKGEIRNLEAQFKGRDGALLTGMISAKVVEMVGERCLLAVTTDIGEHKRMEKDLREAEDRLRTLINAMPDFVCFKDGQGRWLEMNDSGLKAFHMEGLPYKGKAEAELGELQPLLREAFSLCGHSDEDAWRNGHLTQVEETLPNPEGEPRVFDVFKIPLFEPDGSRRGLVALGRDVTSQQKAVKELQRSEAVLSSIIAANPYAIQLVDKEGHHVRHNQAFLDLFGMAPPPTYSIFEDPLLQAARFTDKLRACLQGQRVSFPDLWYDVHDFIPEAPSRKLCLRSTAFPLVGHDRDVNNVVIMHEDITEWKRAEEALRSQEAQYRTLFFTMAQGVVYQDSGGRILSANPAAERILGQSLDQIKGRTSMDPRWGCIQEDGTPFLGENHPAMVALRSGKAVEHVVMGVFHASEGRYHWVVVNAIPEFIPGQDQPWRVFSTITDITELKATQDHLRRTAQWFYAVLNNSQAVIFQLDPEGRFLLSEGRGLALLGLRPGQVVGLSALEMYRDSPTTLAAIKTALTGAACRAFLEVRGLVFDTNLSPVLGENGAVESVIGVSTDVTDREKAQRALMESERKFRDLLDKLGEGFGLVDADETFTFTNPAAEAIFGVGEGQLVGRNLSEFTDAEEFQSIRAHSLQRTTGQKETYEFSIRRPNGERRQILVNVTPTLDDKGKFQGASGLIQDITESRQAEEALRQAQKLESLGVLAGGIAHDFNNLLTAILGNLNLAQTRLEEDSDALPFLHNVEKTVLRAADLTKQMLAYSGKGRFVVKRHDLNTLVQEMTHLLQVSIPKKTSLRFMLHSEALPIDADGAQIHQVVMNLVTNAADAIGEAEGAISIATRIEEVGPGEVPAASPGQTLAPGTYAVFQIRDSGCGMGPDVIARIFDPFFSTKAAGRGLGLSAMLGILRGHKAGIHIQSEPQRGSTFTLYFPSSGTMPREQESSSATKRIQFKGEALVVDDEPMVLEFATQAIATLGFQPTEARDGAEAVECFSQNPGRFDLILLDLTMPRMDGREALRAIRKLRPEIPVILSSGYSDQECLQDLATEQALRFLQKPYQLADLRQAVQSLLNRGKD